MSELLLKQNISCPRVATSEMGHVCPINTQTIEFYHSLSFGKARGDYFIAPLLNLIESVSYIIRILMTYSWHSVKVKVQHL